MTIQRYWSFACAENGDVRVSDTDPRRNDAYCQCVRASDHDAEVVRAVAEEREACASCAENVELAGRHTAGQALRKAAEAIRARAKT